MERRKKTGDILNELFMDSPEESVPGLKGLTELVYRNDQSSKERAEKQNFSQPDTESGFAKKKVAYYLSEKVLVELSDAKAKIKVMVPRGMKSRVSMSRIVDYAVNAILEEFKTVGQKSDLVKNILEDE